MLDLLIKGGRVVDGSGALAFDAAIGVKDGRIAALGEIDEPAATVIDADGLVVAPGFIDLHTHYDAQVFWDPQLSSSTLHGVTTAFAGNCGFTIAPMTPDAGGYLVPMLARVEGMPLESLEAGVPWGTWNSHAEYFDLLAGRLGINIGFSVGHSTLRRIVMGDEATRREATPEEIDAMATLLRAGLAAGAMGFSTSRGANHLDSDGEAVPSRHATPEEVITLAAVCREFPGTSLEMVPTGYRFTDEERYMMPRMSAAAGRPLNWNSIVPSAEGLSRHLENLELGDVAASMGGRVVALSQPIDFAVRFSFINPFVLDALPGWAGPMALPPDARLRYLLDPDNRRSLAASARTTTTHRDLVDWGAKLICETFAPSNTQFEGRSVAGIAAERGVEPFEALLDIVCADQLRTTFSRKPPERTAADWEACAAIWRDPRVVIGASDAGAHLDILGTYQYPTYMLGTVVRDNGVLTLEEAVKLMTSDPARLYGLRDRGTIETGAHADLVIFDESSVANEEVRTRWDLPAGGPRLFGSATGIEHVLVAGVEVVRHGEATSALPGAVVRSGLDSVTPSLAVGA